MRSARGTVRFTIVIWPPPTSSLSFTSEKSGSMPVVSQSIRKLIVPVGASTVACALRCPCCSPTSTASSHGARAAASRPASTCSSISYAASRCLRITRRCGSRFFANSSYGPIAAASSPEVRYARPVISAVIAAATERPSCES